MTDTAQLAQHIEALLFYAGEPLSNKQLATMLKVGASDIPEALDLLARQLEGHGLKLVRNGEDAALVTTSETAESVERARKEDLSRTLGKAASETLAIILYQGPVTRSKIEYVRGVNSTFTLRNLLIRGLVKRTPHPADQRSFLYAPTLELLAHLGISSVEELPEFDTVRHDLALFVHERTDGQPDQDNGEIEKQS